MRSHEKDNAVVHPHAQSSVPAENEEQKKKKKKTKKAARAALFYESCRSACALLFFSFFFEQSNARLEGRGSLGLLSSGRSDSHDRTTLARTEIQRSICGRPNGVYEERERGVTTESQARTTATDYSVVRGEV